MKYLAILKSTKGLLNVLPKLPKAPYDSFGSAEREHLPEKISPYLDKDGSVVIPFTSDSRYHWWAGGQSVKETVKELKEAINEKYTGKN